LITKHKHQVSETYITIQSGALCLRPVSSSTDISSALPSL